MKTEWHSIVPDNAYSVLAFVTTGGKLLLKQDPQRISLTLSSTAAVIVGRDTNPKTGGGIYLPAGGWPYTYSIDNGDFWIRDELYAIGDSAAGSLYAVASRYLE